MTLGRKDFSVTRTDGGADVFRLRSFAAWSPEIFRGGERQPPRSGMSIAPSGIGMIFGSGIIL